MVEADMATRRYHVTVDADGNCRAEDVPPGQYRLHVTISTRDEFTAFTVQPKQVEVPPIDGDRTDEPLDVGLILVEQRE
jgi:hypothetical protein